MTLIDPSFHIRDLATRQARRASAQAGDELLPLSVAAAIAYAYLVGDATEVSNLLLQERLDHIALALSAVAKLYNSEAGENPRLRRGDLPAAIETLRRAGVAFAT